MTWPRLVAIMRYWRKNPPLSTCVAAIAISLGCKLAADEERSVQAPTGEVTDDAVNELASTVGGAGGRIPDWMRADEAAAQADIDALMARLRKGDSGG